MTMLPVSASELQAIQADVSNAACDLSCTIQRATRSTDAQGGASLTWATVATCNAGMAEPTSGLLANYEYLVGALATWLIRLPVGTNVLEEDRLIISGETLLVKKVLTPRSYASLLSLLAVEVK